MLLSRAIQRGGALLRPLSRFKANALPATDHIPAFGDPEVSIRQQLDRQKFMTPGLSQTPLPLVANEDWAIDEETKEKLREEYEEACDRRRPYDNTLAEGEQPFWKCPETGRSIPWVDPENSETQFGHYETYNKETPFGFGVPQNQFQGESPDVPIVARAFKKYWKSKLAVTDFWRERHKDENREYGLVSEDMPTHRYSFMLHYWKNMLRLTNHFSTHRKTSYWLIDRSIMYWGAVQSHDFLYDLACGDGRILRFAAQKFGCRGVGIDFQEGAVYEARLKAKADGVDHLVTFKCMDIADCEDFVHDEATILVTDIEPWGHRVMMPKYNAFLAKNQKKRGHRIVTFKNAIPWLEPVVRDVTYHQQMYPMKAIRFMQYGRSLQKQGSTFVYGSLPDRVEPRQPFGDPRLIRRHRALVKEGKGRRMPYNPVDPDQRSGYFRSDLSFDFDLRPAPEFTHDEQHRFIYEGNWTGAPGVSYTLHYDEKHGNAANRTQHLDYAEPKICQSFVEEITRPEDVRPWDLTAKLHKEQCEGKFVGVPGVHDY